MKMKRVPNDVLAGVLFDLIDGYGKEYVEKHGPGMKLPEELNLEYNDGSKETIKIPSNKKRRNAR